MPDPPDDEELIHAMLTFKIGKNPQDIEVLLPDGTDVARHMGIRNLKLDVSANDPVVVVSLEIIPKAIQITPAEPVIDDDGNLAVKIDVVAGETAHA